MGVRGGGGDGGVGEGGCGGVRIRIYLRDHRSVGRHLYSSDSHLKQPLSKKPTLQEVTF
jgi:hypothetical protein